MASQVLLFAWPVAIVLGPVVGLIVGPRFRRTFSPRVIQLISAAAGVVAAMVFTPVSLVGVLPDHLVLAATYFWGWALVGMLRSRLLRGMIAGLPLLATVWAVTRPTTFFLIIALGDLTALPQRTMSIGCGWTTTRVARVQLYGWVAHSGYDVTLSTRPWGLPIEGELGRWQFDDAQYSVGDRFSMRLADSAGCTTVIAYERTEEWRIQ